VRERERERDGETKRRKKNKFLTRSELRSEKKRRGEGYKIKKKN
jgi:hypothetical protein